MPRREASAGLGGRMPARGGERREREEGFVVVVRGAQRVLSQEFFTRACACEFDSQWMA